MEIDLIEKKSDFNLLYSASTCYTLLQPVLFWLQLILCSKTVDLMLDPAYVDGLGKYIPNLEYKFTESRRSFQHKNLLFLIGKGELLLRQGLSQ